MRYRLTINFEGPLNAEAATGDRRTVQIDGAGQPPESSDLWRLRGRFVWPEAAEGRPQPAELEIDGPLGGTIGGSLRDGEVTAITDDAGRSEASRLDLWFGVEQSGGRFAGSSGVIRLTGTLERQGFRVSAELDLEAPEEAWLPPNASILSDRELASGASRVGPEARSQRRAEREAEARVRRAGRTG